MLVAGRVSRKFASSSVPVTPMTATVTFPTAGSSVTTGQAITVTATGTGAVSFMEFWADGVQLGTDSSVPYSFAWTPATDGAHTVAAVANDGAGTRVSSVNVNVTANPAGQAAAIPAAATWWSDFEKPEPATMTTGTGWPDDWDVSAGQPLQIQQGQALPYGQHSGCEPSQIIVNSCANFGVPALPGFTTAKRIVHFTVNDFEYHNWADNYTATNGTWGFPHAKLYAIFGPASAGWPQPALATNGEKGAWRAWYYIPANYQVWPHNANDVRFVNFFQFKADNNRIPADATLLPQPDGFWLSWVGWTATWGSLGQDNRTLRLETAGPGGTSLLGRWFEVKAVLDPALSQISWYLNQEATPRYVQPGVTLKSTSATWVFGVGHYAGIGNLYAGNASFVPNGT